MKKLTVIIIVIFLAATFSGVLAGCKKETADPSVTPVPSTIPVEGYTDGIYFAQEDGFSESNGYKYMVTLEVKAGKIVSASWNGANKDGKEDKVTRSESGAYGMVAKGGASAEWHEQAKLAEAYLIKSQNPADINYTDAEGHTDSFSGATIHVKEFFDLAEKALAAGPVGLGVYKDGTYHAEQAEFGSSGWKEFVDITVISGRMVAVRWNATYKDGGDDKLKQSIDGKYGMVSKGGAIAEWHEQAMKVETYLLEKQDPADVNYTNEAGNTDAISGVTIHVSSFFKLAQEALSTAK